MNSNPNPFEKLARSRRFWTAVLSVLGIVLVKALGVPEATAEAIQNTLLLLLAGYITADTAAAWKSGVK